MPILPRPITPTFITLATTHRIGAMKPIIFNDLYAHKAKQKMGRRKDHYPCHVINFFLPKQRITE
jgi:hypothetical protein